jgi:hypothetical protein
MDWRDEPFQHHRVQTRYGVALDGLPFFLSIARAEDGLVQQRWDLRFATRAEAVAAGEALIQLGVVWSVFVNEEVAVSRRAR